MQNSLSLASGILEGDINNAFASQKKQGGFAMHVRKATVFVGALFMLAAMPASADLEWAFWGPTSVGTTTGVFSNGQQVVLNANFTDISAGVLPGGEFTSSPQLPGRPDNTNPSFQRLMTGVPGTFLAAGTPVATIDLSGITVNSSTIIGLGDLKQGGVYYVLEFRDDTGAGLPVSGIVVTPYNVTYTGGLVADLNSLLNITTAPGKLTVDNIHDAGGTYSHTSLTTFSNLPAGTSYIRISAGFDNQEVEGIQVYVASNVVGGIEVTDSQGSATDHTVAFGNATTGGLATHTVTVKNFSGSAAAIGITESPAPPFGIADPANCTISVPVNGECTLTVTFQPSAAVTSNDTFTLDLAGTRRMSA